MEDQFSDLYQIIQLKHFTLVMLRTHRLQLIYYLNSKILS